MSKNGLPTVVPKTILDAMTVVTNLGFRYLWVDRYCIPQGQDKDSIQVRTEMIEVMGAIYATSALTIIQAAGEGPEDGLAGVSANRRYVQPAIGLDDHRSIVGIGTPASNIRRSTWNTRAWTFQEGVLARRRLVFTHCQAYFQCQEMQCIESLSANVPFDHRILTAAILPPYYHEGQNEKIFGNQYEPCMNRQTIEAFEFIERYAGRKLTHAGDAYDAFRGIIELFKSRNPPLYFFEGIPMVSPVSRHNRQTAQQRQSEGQIGVAELSEEMEGLAFALSWGFYPTFEIMWQGSELHSMVRRIQFPSWTWLGWEDCPLEYNFHLLMIFAPSTRGLHSKRITWNPLEFNTSMVRQFSGTQIGVELALSRRPSRSEYSRLKGGPSCSISRNGVSSQNTWKPACVKSSAIGNSTILLVYF